MKKTLSPVPTFPSSHKRYQSITVAVTGVLLLALSGSLQAADAPVADKAGTSSVTSKIAGGDKAKDYGDISPDDGSHASALDNLLMADKSGSDSAKDYGDIDSDDGSHVPAAQALQTADKSGSDKAKDYGDTGPDDGSHAQVVSAAVSA